MNVLRVLDAFCASCDSIHPHAVMDDDPSSCFCNRCGSAQPLMVPIGSSRVHRRTMMAARTTALTQ